VKILLLYMDYRLLMDSDSNLTGLATRGIHYWKENGTMSTLKKTSQKFLKHKYQKSLCNNIIKRDAIINIGQSKGNVWFGKPESKFTIREIFEKDKVSSTDGLAGQYEPKQRYLSEIPDCYIVGPSAVGIWDESDIILDTASGNIEKFKSRFADFFPLTMCQELNFGNLDKQTTKSVSGPILSLVPYQDQYYYHWLLEQLPKLRLLDLYTNKTGRTPKIIVPSNPPSFVIESLEMMGYSEDNVIFWDNDIIHTDSLLVTDHRSYSPHRDFYAPSKTDCEWVRDRLVNQVNHSNCGNALGRTYISRQEAVRGRSIVNFCELNNWLKKHSFNVKKFENYQFSKQVQIANQSKIIMGPVGAGMSNILFGDDLFVVELSLDGWTLSSYFYLRY